MSDAIRNRFDDVTGAVGEAMADAVHDAKPRLRGWLHLGTAPVTLAAGITLIALSPNAETRLGSLAFVLTALVLFTVSAVYHTGNWSPTVWAFLRRWDHANIFLLIAGSYTPFTLILLDGAQRAWLLTLVWSGAILGVLFRVFWISAPRWLYVPIYLALGWAAVFFIPGFAHGAATRLGLGIGTAVLVLVIVGGALYTLGGIVYGLKRPDPSPRWFG